MSASPKLAPSPDIPKQRALDKLFAELAAKLDHDARAFSDLRPDLRGSVYQKGPYGLTVTALGQGRSFGIFREACIDRCSNGLSVSLAHDEGFNVLAEMCTGQLHLLLEGEPVDCEDIRRLISEHLFPELFEELIPLEISGKTGTVPPPQEGS